MAELSGISEIPGIIKKYNDPRKVRLTQRAADGG